MDEKKTFSTLNYLLLGWVIWVLIMCIISCMPRYEVIQPVEENVYHLQGIKKKDVLIILSTKELKSGEIIRPKKENLYINYQDAKHP